MFKKKIIVGVSRNCVCYGVIRKENTILSQRVEPLLIWTDQC